MSAVCPNGHTSTADDYCDVCGAPIDPAAVTPTGSAPAATPPGPATTAPAVPTAPAAPTGQSCPNCGTENAADALFCENCGYDFTTGTMPRPPEAETPTSGTPAPLAPPAPDAGASPPAAPAAGFDFVAEVWIDPEWYAAQESPDPMPSPGLPFVVPLRGRSLLIGRTSKSRNIHPEIDCDADSGVSRRQAQLTTDGARWFVEDLESANGTFVAAASGGLPSDPIQVGVKRELLPDDRIYLGAWTRIVIRPATDGERSTLAG